MKTIMHNPWIKSIGIIVLIIISMLFTSINTATTLMHFSILQHSNTTSSLINTLSFIHIFDNFYTSITWILMISTIIFTIFKQKTPLTMINMFILYLLTINILYTIVEKLHYKIASISKIQPSELFISYTIILLLTSLLSIATNSIIKITIAKIKTKIKHH